MIEPAAPPPGFQASTGRGPFSSHNGPFFHKIDGDSFYHGFWALERHCNGLGIVHGGLLMAFMDGLLGAAVWRGTGGRAVTLRMTSDFLSMARPGEWVEGTARCTDHDDTVAYVAGCVYVGERRVLTANALFKMMRAKG